MTRPAELMILLHIITCMEFVDSVFSSESLSRQHLYELLVVPSTSTDAQVPAPTQPPTKQAAYYDYSGVALAIEMVVLPLFMCVAPPD